MWSARCGRPSHFAKAVGETVSVKTRPQVPGERRLRGRLVAADDDGFELEVDDGAGTRRLSYTDIDRARTVFVWGPEPASQAEEAPHRPARPPCRAGEGDGEEEAGRYPMSKPNFEFLDALEPDRP